MYRYDFDGFSFIRDAPGTIDPAIDRIELDFVNVGPFQGPLDSSRGLKPWIIAAIQASHKPVPLLFHFKNAI